MDLDQENRPIARYIIGRLDKTDRTNSQKLPSGGFPSKATFQTLGDELKVSPAPPIPLGVQSVGGEVRSLGDESEVSPAPSAPPMVQSTCIEGCGLMKEAEDRRQKKQDMQALLVPPFVDGCGG